ncbi:S8 family peptidase [Desulfoscipio geothermicus]|uniref:Serine protease AprX n=1 Tax=Desulfoscipio geothermicus DSM 3669 TaxID=1121426 RepID=A0A1I6CRR5_9FIRM|nr:S8 family peptidase [Desulfoscipio geothermicus]SFQ95839.1 serine protease AprX [Desulfoscipio geothermicus DSM 3669]
MLFHQVKWLRVQRGKLCPVLKKRVLADYKPVKYVPCFLQGLLKKVKRNWRKHPVIVQFDGVQGNSGELSLLSSVLRLRVKRHLGIINAVAAELNSQQVEQVVKHPSVVRVWYDREVRALLNVASPTVGASDLWQLPNGRGITGDGVSIAVIDTGIYPHEDLQGRIKYFKDFVQNKTEPYDDNGHGTHVAGCAAGDGSRSEGQFCGAAPGAGLVGLKVLDKYGSGSLSTVIEAVQWCRDNKDEFNIRVANLSLGSAAAQSYKEDPLCMAVEELWRAGVVVCAAAGNDGPTEKTINTPGIDPLVITVGASNDFNTVEIRDDEVAEFSSQGPTIDELIKPDLLTPGENIISLRVPGSLLDKKNNSSRYNNYYTVLSGTSMATPICSGVAALLWEAEPDATPDLVKEKLVSTCRSLGDYPPNVQGAGLVDANEAVKLLLPTQYLPS